MSENLTITYEEFTEADIPELTQVMRRAFDDDAQKYLGQERSGPPGYDNGDFFREWLFGYEESLGYKIMVDSKAVGAFMVWIYDHGKNSLGTIFVDPDFQDLGIGSRAWQHIEATFSKTESWRLDTPGWATKNHHFYEQKCGFTKIDTKDGFFIYHKEMG
jgi:ribosomal protein S18 acetylase RimI-like enzyme